MTYLRVVILLGAISLAAPDAWAQYALYGSPEMVRLPQVQTPTPPPSLMNRTPSLGSRAINHASYNVAATGQPLSTAYLVPSPGPVVQPPNKPLPPAPLMPTPSPSDRGPVPLPPVAPAARPAEAPSLEPIPQSQDVVNQMLREAGGMGAPAPAPMLGVPGPMPFGQPVYAPSPECAPGPVCGVTPKWYASARGLIMTRSKANRLTTTFETGNFLNQIPTDAHWDWAGGGEIRFGRWFGVDGGCSGPTDCYGGWGSCGSGGCDAPWALEGVYWSLADFNYTATGAIAGGSVDTPLIVDNVTFGGIPATQYFNVAQMHRVRHHSELHNIEVNVLSGQPFPSGEMLDLNWFVGARYFRFADELNFATLDLGWTWGSGGGIHEAYLHDRVTNDLVGCQFGFNAKYLLGFNLRLFLNPSFGVYGNHMINEFQLYRGDGVGAVPGLGSGSYPVRSTKDTVALMSQIDVGLDWQFAPNWSANIGYRVLFATGIALSDQQIPAYLVDIPAIAAIDSSDSLVLHGGFAGLTWQF